MGGVGREAHTGAGQGTGNVRSTLNLDWSILDLCSLKDEKRGGKLGCCE